LIGWPLPVGAALSGIQQQCKSKMGARANGMVHDESGHLIFGPGVKTVALGPELLNARSRVASNHSGGDSVIEQLAQHFEQVVRRFWRVSLCYDDASDVRVFKPSDRFVAMIATETLQNVPAHFSRTRLEQRKYQRVVGHDQLIDSTRLGALYTDVGGLPLHALQRRRVLAHEVVRPR
jgi:hypothetical protein